MAEPDFFHYQDYLQSPEWKAKAALVKRQQGHRCGLCGQQGELEIHHLNYNRIKHEQLGDLIAVCENCHSKIHALAVGFQWAGVEFGKSIKYAFQDVKALLKLQFVSPQVCILCNANKNLITSYNLKTVDKDISAMCEECQIQVFKTVASYTGRNVKRNIAFAYAIRDAKRKAKQKAITDKPVNLPSESSEMMSKKAKYYVVWKGRKTGIFTTWDECSKQVTGFENAEYKSFESREAAEKAFTEHYSDYLGTHTPSLSQARLLEIGNPIKPSLAVDASCIDNPGVLEYRCVNTETGEEVFKQGPFQQGTNNIGEFLAVVHALALSKKKGETLPIYTDSENAISWTQNKKCKTKLVKNEQNATLFELIERAEIWLKNNEYPNKVLKWETDAWGEIPADYGRK